MASTEISVGDSKTTYKLRRLNLHGDEVNQVTNIAEWFEELRNQAQACKSWSLCNGGMESYEKDIPFRPTKYEPKLPDLDKMVSKTNVSPDGSEQKTEQVPVYSEVEKAKKRDEHAEKKREYDHRCEVERVAYEDKAQARAQVLWAVISKSLTDGGRGHGLDIQREASNLDVMDRCCRAIRLVLKRKASLESSMIPKLTLRSQLCMPRNMDPVVFISEKKKILKLQKQLGMEIDTSSKSFIVNLKAHIPKELYKEALNEFEMKEQRDGIDAREINLGPESNLLSLDADKLGVVKDASPSKPTIDESTFKFDDKIQAVIDKSSLDPAIIEIFKSLGTTISELRSKDAVAVTTNEFDHRHPLSVEYIQRTLSRKYDQLVKDKSIKEVTMASMLSYFMEDKSEVVKDITGRDRKNDDGTFNADERKKHRERKRGERKTDETPQFRGKCRNCDEPGHKAVDCPHDSLHQEIEARVKAEFQAALKKKKKGKSDAASDTDDDKTRVSPIKKSRNAGKQRGNGRGVGVVSFASATHLWKHNSRSTKITPWSVFPSKNGVQAVDKLRVSKSVGVVLHGRGSRLVFNVTGDRENETVAESSDEDDDPVVPPDYYVEDGGSNADIVSSAAVLRNVIHVDASIKGIGVGKVIAMGQFVGMSIDRDGTEKPFARRRVLVVPGVDRSIIGTSQLRRQRHVRFWLSGDAPYMSIKRGDDITKYDLHSNPEDEHDSFLYFRLRPLDDDELTDEHDTFLTEAHEELQKEIRTFQAQARSKARKKVKKQIRKSNKQLKRGEEPRNQGSEAAELDRQEQKVRQANEKSKRVSREKRRVRFETAAGMAGIDEDTTVREGLDSASSTSDESDSK